MPLFPETRVRRRDKDGIYSDANSKDLRVGRVHGLQPLGDRLRRTSCGRRRAADYSPVDEPGGENTVLIVAGVIVIIVAVVAFAAFFWRRMGKQGTPPPPPP